MSQGLARLRLKGLLIVVALVVGAVRTMRGDTSMFGDVRPLARRYGRLAGEDPDVARAEVLRIVRQLLPLDARMRLAGELPRQVTGAEFEQAADALLGFYGEAVQDNHLPRWQAANAARQPWQHLIAGSAVEEFSDDVGVAVVPGCLLDHVDEDGAQIGRSADRARNDGI